MNPQWGRLCSQPGPSLALGKLWGLGTQTQESGGCLGNRHTHLNTQAQKWSIEQDKEHLGGG